MFITKVTGFFILATSTIAMLGCAGLQERLQQGFRPTEQNVYPKQDDPMDEVTDAAEKYLNCMDQGAIGLVTSSSSAYEIADAAHAGCTREINYYGQIAEAYSHKVIGLDHIRSHNNAVDWVRSTVASGKSRVIKFVVEQRTAKR